MLFSVIIPVYKCEKSINELCERLIKALNSITQDFEIIFVNDQSPLNDWEIINKISKEDCRIKGINLSRNFGQHYAIRAGIDYATGKWIVIMDGDLQDQPEEIVRFYEKALEGYEIVLGKRMERKDNFFKRNTSKLFFSLYNYLTGIKNDRSVGNFALYSEKVIDSYRTIKERDQALILFIDWLGFKKSYIEIKHSERLHGKSSYSFNKLITLAISNIASQSNKPLIISIKFGFIMSILSFIYGLILIINRLFFNMQLGWTSIMVSIFFTAGLILANMGILGLYLGKTFDEAKNRPLYFVSETIGF